MQQLNSDIVRGIHAENIKVWEKELERTVDSLLAICKHLTFARAAYHELGGPPAVQPDSLPTTIADAILGPLLLEMSNLNVRIFELTKSIPVDSSRVLAHSTKLVATLQALDSIQNLPSEARSILQAAKPY